MYPRLQYQPPYLPNRTFLLCSNGRKRITQIHQPRLRQSLRSRILNSPRSRIFHYLYQQDRKQKSLKLPLHKCIGINPRCMECFQRRLCVAVTPSHRSARQSISLAEVMANPLKQRIQFSFSTLVSSSPSLSLQLDTSFWRIPTVGGILPPPLRAHTTTPHRQKIYLFGGTG